MGLTAERGSLKAFTTMVIGGALVLSMGLPAVADDLPQNDDVVAPQSLEPAEEPAPAPAEPVEQGDKGTPKAPVEPADTPQPDNGSTTNSVDSADESSENVVNELEPEHVEDSVAELFEPQSVEPQAGDFSPLVAGPEGAAPPYVYWENRDTSGVLVGGATYQLEGPRTSRSLLLWETDVGWNYSATVVDNTGQPEYNGLDLDPTPGEFLVQQIGSHNIVDTNRYRVRQVTPPSGYTFVNTANPWVEIPGNRNIPNGWSNQTYDFGDFQVRKIPPMSPVCEPGYAYGILSTGQIRQVSPAGSVTSLGDIPVSGGDFNGLGIGPGGAPVYAYARSGNQASDQRPSIYKYDTDTGTWSNTGTRVPVSNTTGVVFVGGAVDLESGNYYLGGFAGTGSNRQFRLWEYNPITNTITYKGAIAAGGTGDANGDMALDADGNLFVVRGAGTTATIYSVTRADLVTASGSTIPSAVSETVTGTLNSVNGIAFDADGMGYLSNGSAVYRYTMPEWGNSEAVTTGLSVTSGWNTYSSTDLATCGSPPTITIEKVIEGGRHVTTDQFTLRLHQGNTLLGTATTTGNTTGVQGQRVGPLPTVRNAALTISETGASETNLSNYVSSYRCYVDDEQYTQGTGTTGTITIPSSGQEVLCQFFNSPITAKVTINKLVADAAGENPQPREGWSVGAEVAAQAGGVTTTPNTPSQATNANGKATWDLKFATTDSTARVTVSEDIETEPGFEFLEGQCLVTHLDGTTSLIELEGAEATEIAGVQPGDSVECVYVNKLKETNLTLVKQIENPDSGTGYADEIDWTLTATRSDGANNTVLTGPTGTTGNVPAGTYTLSETFSGTGEQGDGYYWSDLVCEDADGVALELEAFSREEVGGQITSGRLTLVPGDDVTCTFTNTPLTGGVTWLKIDDSAQGMLLNGSEWQLTLPDGTSISVLDCVGANEPTGAACEIDTDERGGYFELKSLVWGEYTLVETKAPAGYFLDSAEHVFTISAASLTHAFEEGFVNERREGPDLPLTGGLGRDFYTLLGLSILVLGGGAAAVIRIRNRRKEVA